MDQEYCVFLQVKSFHFVIFKISVLILLPLRYSEIFLQFSIRNINKYKINYLSHNLYWNKGNKKNAFNPPQTPLKNQMQSKKIWNFEKKTQPPNKGNFDQKTTPNPRSIPRGFQGKSRRLELHWLKINCNNFLFMDLDWFKR